MLKPRQDFILVKPLLRFQSSVIEVVSHEKHCRGEVVAVGPGKRDKKGNIRPLEAQVGDIVAFGDGSFDFYPEWRETPEGPVHRLIQEADIAFIEVQDEGNTERVAPDEFRAMRLVDEAQKAGCPLTAETLDEALRAKAA